MSMFKDIFPGSRNNGKKCESNARLVSYTKRFGKGQRSFIGPGSEKKYSLSVKMSHEENGTTWLKRCCWHSSKIDIQLFESRLHCPKECFFFQKRWWWKIADPLLCRPGDWHCFSHNCFCKSAQFKHQKLSQELQRNLVLDGGYLLVQVLKRSGILEKRNAHKEFGIISWMRCCWNSLKVDVLFSRPKLHCPVVIS